MYFMDSKSPEELAEKFKTEKQQIEDIAVDVLDWFLDNDNIGELYLREDLITTLSDELNHNSSIIAESISSVVGDIVDPVQQVVTDEGKFVGVIDYKVFGDEGAYGYIHFDDIIGSRKRVVCARCVEKYDRDRNVSHATQGQGSCKTDASWSSLLNKVTSHYVDEHEVGPEEIEPGASLASGTTISGNTAHHSGNYSAPVQSWNNQTGSISYSAPVQSVNSKTGDITIDSESWDRYGSAVDGTVQFSSNTTVSHEVYATDQFIVDSGVTLTANSLVVYATDSVTIDGTIDLSGNGGQPGEGRNEDSGTSGVDGFGPADAGDGGDSEQDGGSGGIGKAIPQALADPYRNDAPWSAVFGTETFICGGGGGGGGAVLFEGTQGGDGGAGGGGVVFSSPDINVSGLIDMSGNDGKDGGDDGGGGGGAGGTVIALGSGSVSSSSVDVSGGTGGPGNSSGEDGEDGSVLSY